MCSIYSDISEEEDLFIKQDATIKYEQKIDLKIPTAAVYHEPHYNCKNFPNINHNIEVHDFQDNSSKNILFVKSCKLI